MNSLKVRAAKIGDLEKILSMYRAAQNWLAKTGTDQWSKNTPERARNLFESYIAKGACYVAEISDVVVGTITVDDFADPEFWTESDRPEAALYVHRMVVDRSFSGQNIGSVLLDWAGSVATASGRDFLRLDAWRTNAALHRYYVRQGFYLVRIVELDHRGSGALFERAAKP